MKKICVLLLIILLNGFLCIVIEQMDDMEDEGDIGPDILQYPEEVENYVDNLDKAIQGRGLLDSLQGKKKVNKIAARALNNDIFQQIKNALRKKTVNVMRTTTQEPGQESDQGQLEEFEQKLENTKKFRKKIKKRRRPSSKNVHKTGKKRRKNATTGKEVGNGEKYDKRIIMTVVGKLLELEDSTKGKAKRRSFSRKRTVLDILEKIIDKKNAPMRKSHTKRGLSDSLELFMNLGKIADLGTLMKLGQVIDIGTLLKIGQIIDIPKLLAIGKAVFGRKRQNVWKTPLRRKVHRTSTSTTKHPINWL